MTSISSATLAQLADVSTQCGWISVPLHTNPPSVSYRVGMTELESLMLMLAPIVSFPVQFMYSWRLIDQYGVVARNW